VHKHRHNNTDTCQEDLSSFRFGELEETTRAPSYCGFRLSSRTWNPIPLPEWSNWCGSESSTLETDGYVWHYTLLVLHARNDYMMVQLHDATCDYIAHSPNKWMVTDFMPLWAWRLATTWPQKKWSLLTKPMEWIQEIIHVSKTTSCAEITASACHCQTLSKDMYMHTCTWNDTSVC